MSNDKIFLITVIVGGVCMLEGVCLLLSAHMMGQLKYSLKYCFILPHAVMFSFLSLLGVMIFVISKIDPT